MNREARAAVTRFRDANSEVIYSCRFVFSVHTFCLSIALFVNVVYINIFSVYKCICIYSYACYHMLLSSTHRHTARRRAAAKRKKLKTMHSKSTDEEEEEEEEEEGKRRPLPLCSPF